VSLSDRFHVRLRLDRGRFVLDVALDLPASGVTALFGPSGSGKTTVLRCVAGLERAPSGEVRLGDSCWQDEASGHFVPTWQRPLGYVFQEASLFDHLDVAGNLRFGLPRRPTAAQVRALDQAVALLGIERLLPQRTHQLSGRRRQPVAMARSPVTPPGLLLLDEPMASLDAARKQEILPWLERLRDELAIPMLYVSHSADEVARLANTVVVLEAGRVRQTGPVDTVLSTLGPQGGDDNGVLLMGRLADRDADHHLVRVAFDGGGLWMRDDGLPLGQAVRVRVLARDVSLTLHEPRDTSIQNHWAGHITALHPGPHPSQVLVQVQCGATALQSRVTTRALQTLGLAVGSAVWVQVKSAALAR